MTRWTGRCASRGFALLGVGLTLVLVALGVGSAIALKGSNAPAWVAWLLVVVGLVSGLATLALASLEVRVTDERFVVAFGPLGWPRRTIELGDVTGVQALTIHPLEWGGWGYRWNPWAKASAAVIRKGPGIALTLADGRRFAVTVNDAEAGARATSEALAARG